MKPDSNNSVRNVTRKKVLVSDVELADSIGKKTKGLMFRESLGKDAGLLMTFEQERRHEIWMFGMRFPIDIIFIDREKRIVDVKRDAKPMGRNPFTWKIYRPGKKCCYVLETRSGLADRTKSKVGDQLDF
jgi:hypothetical protein